MIDCCRFLFFLFCLLLRVSEARTPPETCKRPNLATKNATVSALLVMGDSTVDPGNNNYIATIVKSNFPPYGIDFKNHVATGRFSNGRLPSDFAAFYLGLKDYIPAYLNPDLGIKDLVTGVSFASAGCGYDPFTGALLNIKSVPTQMEHLKEYKAKLESWMGKEETENHMKKAVVFLSSGTNDFVNAYFMKTVGKEAFPMADYEKFILDIIKTMIQNLWKEGLRKIAVSGLPPIGCLPIVITLFSKDRIRQRDCVEDLNFISRDYNLKLQQELKSIESNFSNTQIFYADIYIPLIDMIQGKEKSSFRRKDIGCCGNGYMEFAFLCNPGSYLCPNASEYVFFDAIHPTEKAYHYMVNANQDIINKLLEG